MPGAVPEPPTVMLAEGGAVCGGGSGGPVLLASKRIPYTKPNQTNHILRAVGPIHTTEAEPALAPRLGTLGT